MSETVIGRVRLGPVAAGSSRTRTTQSPLSLSPVVSGGRDREVTPSAVFVPSSSSSFVRDVAIVPLAGRFCPRWPHLPLSESRRGWRLLYPVSLSLPYGEVGNGWEGKKGFVPWSGESRSGRLV